MCLYLISLVFVSLTCGVLSSDEFTISSYNCGGLSEHYDYLRAASMQKLMQERHIAEPENMELNDAIQKLALKILFSFDAEEQQFAKREWERKNYQQFFECLTAPPTAVHSPNTLWQHKANQMITSYKERPVVISDEEVVQMVQMHGRDLSPATDPAQRLTDARAVMAKRIFAHHLKYDIICLQEADYLDTTMFPAHYVILFSDTAHSKNGIAWNKNRFELVESFGSILDKALAIKLLDKENGKILLVASGHLTGCNPYRIEISAATGVSDSQKGDHELQNIIDLFERQEADFTLIGMDSNVTALHPRLRLLKDAGYQLDYENHLEATCTNPYQVLNTRIDWIALKAKNYAALKNIPVLGVGLNNIQTNLSDHKPIAAKIRY